MGACSCAVASLWFQSAMSSIWRSRGVRSSAMEPNLGSLPRPWRRISLSPLATRPRICPGGASSVLWPGGVRPPFRRRLGATGSSVFRLRGSVARFLGWHGLDTRRAHRRTRGCSDTPLPRPGAQGGALLRRREYESRYQWRADSPLGQVRGGSPDGHLNPYATRERRSFSVNPRPLRPPDRCPPSSRRSTPDVHARTRPDKATIPALRHPSGLLRTKIL